MLLFRAVYLIALFLLPAGGAAAQSPALPQLSAMAGQNRDMPAELEQKQQDSSAPAPLRLLQIQAETRGAGAAAKLHIKAVFNRKPDCGVLILAAPPRFIVTLPAVQFAFPAGAVGSSALLRDFRFGLAGAGRARLVFGLKKPFRLQAVRSEALFTADKASAWQIIWELAPVEAADFRQYLALRRADFGRTAMQEDNEKPFIVVLDPGHGGFDSGAVSKAGTQEKRVSLAFAEILARRLRQKQGIEAYLTRGGDSFLRLNQRVELARRLRADLFISIHADHIDTESLAGATVYTLSDKASDDMAKLLAERENKADLPDGLPADEPPAIADILLDMTRRETRNFSEDFARMAVESLRRGHMELIKNPHRFAGFQVLRAADIPSVLIELGYLSNPQDEKKITDLEWQRAAAALLAETIGRYAAARGKSGEKP